MKKGYVSIGENVFETLFAISEAEQARGLMFEENPPNMSFLYSKSKYNAFWMKNTPAPLDIIFCNNNVVVDIKTGTPFSTSMIGGDKPSNLIIEVPRGIAKKFGIKKNDEVKILLITEN